MSVNLLLRHLPLLQLKPFLLRLLFLGHRVVLEKVLEEASKEMQVEIQIEPEIQTEVVMET